jgi:protein-tyrosine phosphatase
VRRDFVGRVEWILDSGPSRHRLASTVVLVEDGGWQILRAGALDRRSIADAATLRILFVCTGNLCRSPMAAAILRRMLADRLCCDPTPEDLEARGYRIASAGTAGLDGQPATPEAVEAVRALGADLADHRSRPLSPGLVDASDRVIVMTRAQERILLEFAWDARDRISMLEPSGEDVPDPYLQPAEVYERTAGRIRGALETLVEEVTS